MVFAQSPTPTIVFWAVIAAAIGPLLGGFLTTYLSWRVPAEQGRVADAWRTMRR
jgi:MFS family permease